MNCLIPVVPVFNLLCFVCIRHFEQVNFVNTGTCSFESILHSNYMQYVYLQKVQASPKILVHAF